MPGKITREVDLSSLPPGYEKRCQEWFDRTPAENKVLVWQWISERTDFMGVDPMIVAYFETPATLDPWVTCRLPAKAATNSWFAEHGPNVDEILDNGDVLARFRASELEEVTS